MQITFKDDAVKQGQVWSNMDRKEFRIINITEIENRTWVHYINTKTGQEYSCYKESFESRFSPVLNRS
jgi:hypothetical protein